MDRQALLDYLADYLSVPLAEANILPTDTADGLAPVLDAVDQWMALAPDLSPVWERPLGLYYAWDRIAVRLSMNMDTSTAGDSYKLSQQRDFAVKERDKAYGLVSWIVSPVAVTSDGVGILEMPFNTGGDWDESWEGW